MGFFSYLTCDTKRSISNCHASRPVFPVYLITESGKSWKESNYQGYGEFAGKDIYVLIAELNGYPKIDPDDSIEYDKIRSIGIGLASSLTSKYIKSPRLVEKLPSKKDWKKVFNSLPVIERCPDQGFFYND